MNIAQRKIGGGLVLAGLAVAVLLGSGGLLAGADPLKKPAKAPVVKAPADAKLVPATAKTLPSSGPDAAHSESLQADIDRALALISEDKLEELIQDYYPVEMVRALRKKQTTANVANDLRRAKAVLRKLQDRLTRSRNGRLDGNNDEVVTFPSNEPAADAAIPATPAEQSSNSEVPGYGDDLQAALEAAIIDLKANEFEAFIQKMLPVSAVEKLLADEQLAFTAKQYELYPEMAQATIADLEAIRQLSVKPEGDLVRLQLSGRTPGEKEREVRLQRVGGSWRFYDQASELQPGIDRLMERGEKLAADPNAFEPLLKFERIRDHWRLVELP